MRLTLKNTYMGKWKKIQYHLISKNMGKYMYTRIEQTGKSLITMDTRAGDLFATKFYLYFLNFVYK